METALLLLVAILGVASLVALGSVLALHTRLNQAIATLPDAQSVKSLADRLMQVDVSNRASFESLARTIGGLEQATKQMMDVGKTISSLEDLLQPPKLRGGMGETLLSALLGQILPGACEFEHCFASGERVDAVIRLGDRLVPVDAKFPLEEEGHPGEPQLFLRLPAGDHPRPQGPADRAAGAGDYGLPGPAQGRRAALPRRVPGPGHAHRERSQEV